MTAAIPFAAQVAEQQATKSRAAKAANAAVKESESVPDTQSVEPTPKRVQSNSSPAQQSGGGTNKPYFTPKARKKVVSSARTLQGKLFGSLTTGDQYERIIKAEWLFGMLLIFMYPLWKPGFASGQFTKWVSRQIAWTAVFVMLLLLSSISSRVARLCAALGGLILLALLLGPYVTNGQVNFDLGGAKSLQAAIDKLGRSAGTKKESATPLPDDEANRIDESVTPLNVNLGDGMGPVVYRSGNSGTYFPASEWLRRTT